MRSGVVLCLLTVAIGSYAQPLSEELGNLQAASSPRWLNLQGSFLEPNRFATVYDNAPDRLRLEAGFGSEFIQARNLSLGAEILVWSGLKTLDNFRFPVETADYFFGIYSVAALHIGNNPLRLRARLSHISSHLVDGTQDSIIGGSSSRFSREFLSVELLLNRYEENNFALSAGLKGVFHQVNQYEPVLQIPVVIDYRFLRFSSQTHVSAFVSSAAGPSLPVFAGGIVFHSQNMTEQGIELYGEYHSGHSRYGVDGSSKEAGFELGIRLCGSPR